MILVDLEDTSLFIDNFASHLLMDNKLTNVNLKKVFFVLTHQYSPLSKQLDNFDEMVQSKA